MEKEEQILGMMAAAQKQQEAAEQAIESLNLSRKELHAALASQQNKLADDHRELITNHRQQFDGIHTDIQKVLHWLPMIGSIVVTGICCLAIVALMFWYLDGVVDDIAEARAARDQLKNYNIEISTCKRNGEPLPCVRVFNDKAYGDGDVYVLKPK